MGVRRIIFEYVFESATEATWFASHLPREVELLSITLWAPLEVVLHRARNRQVSESADARITRCYRAMQSNIAQLQPVFDTSELRPAEVAEELFRRARKVPGDRKPC